MSFMLARWARLYSNQTPAEKKMEPAVAHLGVPYRTQHPVWALGYFVDFALPTLKLVIEVDDDSHKTKTKRAADEKRTARLNKLGWTVVRCSNDEALDDPQEALERMLRSAGIDPSKPRLPTKNSAKDK